MNHSLLPIGLALLTLSKAFSAGYQAQYPYDPYNSSQQQPSSGYSEYQAPSGGGGGTGGKAYTQVDSYNPDTSILGYAYVGLSYSFTSFSDVTGLDGGSGIKAELSVPLFKPLYLHFAVDWMSGTPSDSDASDRFNLTSVSGGVGVYFPLANRLHFFGEVGAQYDAISGNQGSSFNLGSNNFAIYVRPGLRLAITDRWEVQAAINFNTTNNFNDRVYELSTYFGLVGGLDLGLGVDFASDVTTYHGGIRFRW